VIPRSSVISYVLFDFFRNQRNPEYISYPRFDAFLPLPASGTMLRIGRGDKRKFVP
jgi:hypothetical protein